MLKPTWQGIDMDCKMVKIEISTSRGYYIDSFALCGGVVPIPEQVRRGWYFDELLAYPMWRFCGKIAQRISENMVGWEL